MEDSYVELIPAMDTASEAKINVVGSVVLPFIGKLQQELLAAFAQTENINMDLSGVTELDLAGMQLLCSAHRSSIVQGKQFRVSGYNPLLWEMAAASGHLRNKGCEPDINNTCVWIKER
jgi:ABC-type transporter Mla MlaB component